MKWYWIVLLVLAVALIVYGVYKTRTKDKNTVVSNPVLPPATTTTAPPAPKPKVTTAASAAVHI